METRVLYCVSVLLLAVALVCGTACNLVLPLDPGTQVAKSPYFCSAQIYRELPGGIEEFTEEWQCYLWATAASSYTDAEAKIEEYISTCMAPGFAWDYRNLTAVSTVKEEAVDCVWTYDDLSITPPAYGAPFGAELRWNYPDTAQASAFISVVDNDGDTRTATPGVANAYVDFAERTGLPDSGTYVRGQRHIRFSDIFLELDTPFDLGSGLTVTEFHIQSIGTVIAENVGGTTYQVMPQDSKFYLYAQAGSAATTSFCFTNPYLQGFEEYQGPPGPFFTLSFNLEVNLSGHNLQVLVSLSKPPSVGSFKNLQPYVELVDTTATGPTVDLTPNVAWDGDDNLDPAKFLWFEDFEASSERFLGKGQPLNGVSFSHGQHEITVVAYDAYGSYNSDTMTLTVPNTAPAADTDNFTMDEDSVLSVSAPGVLDNDTDAEGDALSAVLENNPTDGTLTLNSDGSFIYTPNPNFTGTDSFAYRANDGELDSAPATVSIEVLEVPEHEEINDLADMVRALVDAGVLNPGQGTSLITGKLDKAMAYAEAGKTMLACNLLQAFINQVKSLIEEGVLFASEGEPLIDKAENIMQELGCK